jgi:hypothetical protein
LRSGDGSAPRDQNSASFIAGICSLLLWGGLSSHELYLIGEEMSDDRTIERKVITPAEREARKVFAAGEAKKAISEHEKAQKALHENRERLKAERLAREAKALKTNK